jgi:hypothetical protein
VVLEKLIRYEAVHKIQGWEDLRRRLAPDRRCFGFFHPALPGEPLIFIEVALTQGLAAAVQPLLARDDGERAQQRGQENANTAIFYSISNCQAGLRGVSFGNFLIKQVVEELKVEHCRIWCGSRPSLAETQQSCHQPPNRSGAARVRFLREQNSLRMACLVKSLPLDLAGVARCPAYEIAPLHPAKCKK